jgi:hypothetical protein
MPPPLDDCIRAFDADVDAHPTRQIPIDRVFVLGAGFSRAFGFTTSATIVKGVMEFFEPKLPNAWFERNFRIVKRWLDSEYPNWRETSPDLIHLASKFFPKASRGPATFVDPIGLHSDGLSWESGSYPFEPPSPNYEYALRSFEALLCIYLFAGLMMNEVLVGWAEKFAGNLTGKDVVLTLNWDVIPEVLLTQTGKAFTRYEWRQDYVKVVKLHGSIDLIGIPNDKMRQHVAENPRALECLTPLLWRSVTSEGFFPRTRPLPFGRELFPWEWYNKTAVFIMPPYYTFGYGYKLIQFNWRKAEAALQRAKEIIVIGYSLCETDKPFCDLLKAVSNAWPSETRVKVWNPDPTVAGRARSLCGTNRVEFHQKVASEIQL